MVPRAACRHLKMLVCAWASDTTITLHRISQICTMMLVGDTLHINFLPSHMMPSLPIRYLLPKAWEALCYFCLEK